MFLDIIHASETMQPAMKTPLGGIQESPSIDGFNSLNVHANQMLILFYGIIIKR